MKAEMTKEQRKKDTPSYRYGLRKKQGRAGGCSPLDLNGSSRTGLSRLSALPGDFHRPCVRYLFGRRAAAKMAFWVTD
jgi:hypothetical protein